MKVAVIYTSWLCDRPVQLSIQLLQYLSPFNNALASIDPFGSSFCVSTTADAVKQAIRGSLMYIEDNLRYYATFNDVNNQRTRFNVDQQHERLLNIWATQFLESITTSVTFIDLNLTNSPNKQTN